MTERETKWLLKKKQQLREDRDRKQTKQTWQGLTGHHFEFPHVLYLNAYLSGMQNGMTLDERIEEMETS